MALAIPAEDEKAASLLNVYDVFAPTTKPLWVWEWCVSSRVSHALAAGLVPFKRAVAPDAGTRWWWA